MSRFVTTVADEIRFDRKKKKSAAISEIRESAARLLELAPIMVKHGTHNQQSHGRAGGGGGGDGGSRSGRGKPSEAEIARLHKEDADMAAHMRASKPGLFKKKPWQKLGLDQADAAVLRDYTDMGYQKLNKETRNPPPGELMAIKEKALNTALDKLPNHEGTVFRGLNRARNWEVGSTIEETGFSSSTTNKGIAENNFGGNTFISIKSKTGKEISPMSRFKGEQEVVFKSGTQFKVASKRQEGDKVFYEMEEV